MHIDTINLKIPPKQGVKIYIEQRKFLLDEIQITIRLFLMTVARSYVKLRDWMWSLNIHAKKIQMD